MAEQLSKQSEAERLQYEEQIAELRSHLTTQFQKIDELEQEISEHVAEKSRLQAEALKDKENVMSNQLQLAQLQLQIKDLEMNAKSSSGDSGAKSGGGQDPMKEELYQALLKSNVELEKEKLAKTFGEKERELNEIIKSTKDSLAEKSSEVDKLGFDLKSAKEQLRT